MRRAKIVCTLGPASSDINVLRQMIESGMDVARLNFSHGTHDDHRATFEKIRMLSKEVGRPISILQDLRQKYENLKSMVMEQDRSWDDRVLDEIEVEELVMTPVKDLAKSILAKQKAKA